MPHRDPETGQFVDDEGGNYADRTEEVRFAQNVTVPANQVGGQTGEQLGQEGHFDGVDLYDLGEVVERDELAYLDKAYHRVVAYVSSTSTEDGTIRAAVGVSTDPEMPDGVDGVGAAGTLSDVEGDYSFMSYDQNNPADTDISTVGPTLLAVGFSPFSSNSSGVGGAGTAGTDEWEGSPSAEGRMDARDDFYFNGTIEQSNVDDAALHVDIVGWHQWAVEEDALDRPVRC